MAADAYDVKTPGADHDVATLHGEDDLLFGGGKVFRVPDDVRLGLLAGGVKMLLKVAAAMHERDSDHGGAGIGSRTEGVARKHTETAGVGRQVFGKGDFHGKVGDASGGEIDWGCDGVGKTHI